MESSQPGSRGRARTPGGLADVVDALARALGRIGNGALAGAVDVYLPRYRSVVLPDQVSGSSDIDVPDPRAPSGHSTVTIIDVEADGYRLRLVDHPPAF